MIFAFLSRRVRTWFLFAFVLPTVGRLLVKISGPVGRRNPKAGQALRTAGNFAQVPRNTRRGLRRRY